MPAKAKNNEDAQAEWLTAQIINHWIDMAKIHVIKNGFVKDESCYTCDYWLELWFLLLLFNKFWALWFDISVCVKSKVTLFYDDNILEVFVDNENHDNEYLVLKWPTLKWFVFGYRNEPSRVEQSCCHHIGDRPPMTALMSLTLQTTPGKRVIKTK